MTTKERALLMLVVEYVLANASEVGRELEDLMRLKWEVEEESKS